MTMTTEEKFNKDVFWILGEVQSEMIASHSDQIRYIFFKEDSLPPERQQKRLINWLTDLGAVKITREIHPDDFISNMLAVNPFVAKPATIGYGLKVDTEIFSELTKIYSGDWERQPANEILKKADKLMRVKKIEPPRAEAKKVNMPFFDEETRELTFMGRNCEIPTGNQWALCKELLKKPAGDWIKENDVIEHFSRDGKQSFYDAQRLLNIRIEKSLGIKDFIEYQTAMARINPATIAKLNHSEK